MSEKITVEYQNVREKAREMSDNAKELWDKWEKHKRGYFLVLYNINNILKSLFKVIESDVGDKLQMLVTS